MTAIQKGASAPAIVAAPQAETAAPAPSEDVQTSPAPAKKLPSKK